MKKSLALLLVFALALSCFPLGAVTAFAAENEETQPPSEPADTTPTEAPETEPVDTGEVPTEPETEPVSDAEAPQEEPPQGVMMFSASPASDDDSGSSGSEVGEGGDGSGNAAGDGSSNMIAVGVTMQVVYYRYDECYNRYNSHGNVIETIQTGKAIPWNDTGKDKGETMTTVFDTFTITPNTFIVKARWDSYPYVYHFPTENIVSDGCTFTWTGFTSYWFSYENPGGKADTYPRIVRNEENGSKAIEDYLAQIILGNNYGAWDKLDIAKGETVATDSSLFAATLKYLGASDQAIQNYLDSYFGKLSVTQDGDTLIPTIIWSYVVAENLGGTNRIYTIGDVAASGSSNDDWLDTAYTSGANCNTGFGTCSWMKKSQDTMVCKLMLGGKHSSNHHSSIWKEGGSDKLFGTGLVNRIQTEVDSTAEDGTNTFYYLRGYWTPYGKGNGSISLTKTNAAGNKNLAGAEFTLYRDPACTIPITAGDYYSQNTSDVGYVSASVRKTTSDGKAEWTGLYSGTYFLKETKAPEGYKVNVDSSGNVEVKEVPVANGATDITLTNTEKASLTIWKFDWTNAYKDGVWDEDSFISTGWRESYVEEVLGETVREGDANGNPDHPLGNGQNSNGYALKGVEFTILRVADIVTFTESANDQHPDYNLTQVLYAFDKDKAADLLTAIGLGDGAGRYENADVLNYETSAPLAPVDAEAGVDAQAIAQVRNCWYYQSDVLNKALADALEANATTVKDALEAYVAASDEAIVMDKTNENGKTIKRDLDLGLWLCIETKVPEMVTSTTNPFFISLPMTTVSGDANSASPEGGHFWNYDVVVYPKNNTGIPELTKEVRESVKDTGTNGGTDDINDGFAHAATGSAGDVMEFQILAGLPTITSNATSIKTWQFYDSIDQGLTYNKALKDVKIEIFSNEDCTDKVATWLQDDGKFTVTYSSDDRHMTIDITEAGLDEINGNQENVNGKLFASYSNYTMRVTYTATINSNATVIYGENGNKNEVVLTWKRTSSEYYDTLIDDCHIFTFGVDLTKLFSDLDSESATEMDMFKHVKFRIRNTTDGYWLTANRDEETGIYYVTGHVTEEADGTVFYPVTVGGEFGKIVIKGVEDDSYEIFEIETANGYTLLKDEIVVDIFVEENYDRICDIYTKDVLGVLQNDPHYCFGNAQPQSILDADGGANLHLTGIPQDYLEHYFLTAYAQVDGNDVNMEDDGESANALAPLTVVNTEGFDLPQTGDHGTWMYGVIGITLMAGALVVMLIAFKKKEKQPVQQ